MLIKDICSTITEGSHNPPKGIKSSSYLMLSSKNVLDDKITLDEPRFLSKEDFEKENKRTDVKCDDVLLTIVGTVGRAAVVSNDLPPFALQRSVAVLHPDENVCSGRYLMYALRGKRSYIERHSKGVAQKGIYLKEVAEIDLPVPSKEIQRQIIEKLDKVNSVIKCRQLELEKFDDLIKARFVEMFGDTVTNPLGWEEHRLDEYIDFLTSGSRGWAQYFVDEENELFITIKNVKNNHITLDNIQYVDAPNNKEAERTKVKAGDLLISITADLGRTGVVDSNIAEKGAYINQHLSLVRLDKGRINPFYVSFFLETEGGKRQFDSKNQNGVKAGLNFEAIKSLKILVPPLEMQETYLEFVKATDKLKVAIQKSLEKTQLLFDSLMQEYFG
nr:restriction endonuclease subunit S [Blautia caecimuris]